jgi:hypothetical protein
MIRDVSVRAVLVLAAVAGILPAQEPAKKIDLKVLYTGAPDSRRTKEFTEFLGKTFTQVGTVELTALDAKAAAPFDVVIVDSPSPFRPDVVETPAEGSNYTGPKVEIAKAPDLTTDFTKPTILMGSAGGAVLGKLKIKLQWL